MRTKTKAVCCYMVALMVQAGCQRKPEEVVPMKPDESNNEVVCQLGSIGSDHPGPHSVVYVERNISASRKDVFYLNTDFLVQAYSVEKDTVKNYRWFSHGGLEFGTESAVQGKFIFLLGYLWGQGFKQPWAWWATEGEREWDLPLSDYAAFLNNQERVKNATTTLIYVGIYFKGQFRFDNIPIEPLRLQRWSGLTSDEPDTIKEFCAEVLADVDKPKYAANNPMSWQSKMLPAWTRKIPQSRYGLRKYPSYLRAVPLRTEEELNLTKDIPYITDVKPYYHIQYAVESPYTLIPVPEEASPFPSLNKPYEPGRDKVRVKVDLGEDIHFLIETFKGEVWEGN